MSDRDYRDDYPLSHAIRDAVSEALGETHLTRTDWRSEQDYAVARADRLEAERDRLAEALAFYADPANYPAATNATSSATGAAPVQLDVGERARAALQACDTEESETDGSE